MKKKYLLIFGLIYPSLLLSQPIQHQKDGEKFRVGLYALQDGNNSSISGIINQVMDAHEGVTSNQYEAANIVIPYRTWIRGTYPNFDLNEWFGDYMEEIYEETQHDGLAFLQTISVPLYTQFVDPPFDTSATSIAQIGNDKGTNRTLNTALFDNFINEILQREFDIVHTAVNGDENLIRSILGNKDDRPLGGWYLDDEPLVRNHDTQVINQMGSRIRTLENNFRNNNAVLSQLNTNQYQQKRYIAFDANDLHDHYSSTRKLDGDIYNENGTTNSISSSNKYSIFGSNVDVLMPDFYNHNHQFWHIIIQQIRREYELNSLPIPEIIPIIQGFKNDYSSWFSEVEYTRLRDELIKDDVDGIFLYVWPNKENNNYFGTRGLWDDGFSNIGRVLEGIESFNTSIAKDDLALLYNQNSNAQRTLVLLSDGDSFRDKN
ncbi:hypothetical protein, partial [Gracilimonas tropica]|uniref:hypothetical protein n=1 Tax=Gracilimonas tropica TaxID=454600 RepID=UPI00058C06DE